MYTVLKDAIIEALENLGGKAHYKEIYSEISLKNLYDFSNQKTPDRTISRELQVNSFDTKYGKNGTFYSVYGIQSRKGIWGLSKYTQSNEIDIVEEKIIPNYHEGNEIIKIHKSFERDKKIVNDAKKIFKEKNTSLFCEVCGFDFYKNYGELGKDFIEVHHIVPVSQMIEKNVKPSINNLALVCSNCHRMLHRSIKETNESISITDFKKIINKN